MRSRNYLIVLYKSQKHGDNDLPLCLQFFTDIRLAGSPEQEQVMYNGLQGWYCCRKPDKAIINTYNQSLLNRLKFDNSGIIYFSCISSEHTGPPLYPLAQNPAKW